MSDERIRIVTPRETLDLPVEAVEAYAVLAQTAAIVHPIEYDRAIACAEYVAAHPKDGEQ